LEDIVTDSPRGAAEFDLIARIRQRATARDDVVLGIGDDAAIVQVPPGRQLVIATDTLNRGVHFPDDTAPADIGWKALAVNLSDLAAMGAQPAWCTLSLSLPHADVAWLDGFLDGFLELAAPHRVALIGGDTTRGPLSICVTVHGFVEPCRALRRDSARVGDDVWVSGTLGDAAGALAQWQAGGARDSWLRARLDRPTPRVLVGHAMAGAANAGIDISDGLLADLGHVCTASGVGAVIELDALPTSASLRGGFDPERRRVLQTSGGDDYELCFCAPAEARIAINTIGAEHATAVTRVGRIVAEAGVVAIDRNGQPWQPAHRGHEHFGR
jgi:thiamine-monophosphate kinase